MRWSAAAKTPGETMRRIRRVAICCRDTLRAAGLRNLLVSYFPPMEIDLYATSSEWIRHTDYDMYFVEEEERRLWAEIAARKLVHLSLGAGQGEEGECFLDTSADQHSMVEAIKGFFGRHDSTEKARKTKISLPGKYRSCAWSFRGLSTKRLPSGCPSVSTPYSPTAKTSQPKRGSRPYRDLHFMPCSTGMSRRPRLGCRRVPGAVFLL